MSHFLFGVVDGGRGTGKQIIAGKMEISWGASLQQPIVLRMLELSAKPAPGEAEFSIAEPGHDTADSLVSPYDAGMEKSALSLRDALRWLENERHDKGAELWVTEGYDDAFVKLEGSFEELQLIVESMMHKADEVPSLRLCLSKR